MDVSGGMVELISVEGLSTGLQLEHGAHEARCS